MRSKVKLLLIGLILPVAFQNCNQNASQKKADTFTANNAKFVIDESFKPIVDQELYIFRALYKSFRPTVLYTNENDGINMLLNDSVRIAIMARDLTPEETGMLKSRNLRPEVDRFAIDAVTLIVNNASNDTTISVSVIKKMLNGNAKQDKNIVFDNPNSGLVQYLKKFSGNKDFKQKNIYALKSNKDVIRYVSEHQNAIGITDFSWLNEPDKDYADAVDKVKIVSVRDDGNKKLADQYFSPSQTTLALKQYPLTRDLYIYNFTGNYGLGMEFAAFLISDRGQRIILKSGLLPDDIPPRRINIIKKIKL